MEQAASHIHDSRDLSLPFFHSDLVAGSIVVPAITLLQLDGLAIEDPRPNSRNDIDAILRDQAHKLISIPRLTSSVVGLLRN
jgi:hypothetical protein